MAVWIPPGKDFRLERDPARQFREESPSRAHFSWALTRIAAACPMFADRNTRRNSSFSLTGNSTAKDKTIVRVPDVAIFAAKQGIESVVSRRSKMVKKRAVPPGPETRKSFAFFDRSDCTRAFNFRKKISIEKLCKPFTGAALRETRKFSGNAVFC
ncbi:hypothetical protein [Herbaspirillum robiniae]|uniref:Uncharacterized protein n=2 Tax=Herbaspirillum robiniae TaxID=2014887 RepID=A0ABX2LY67_9BURK|nr:hypothetical protein [Herbaspirillum robiniae]NUU00519.1 hypothetical protein [Herbaspirillum robiniae]